MACLCRSLRRKQETLPLLDLDSYAAQAGRMQLFRPLFPLVVTALAAVIPASSVAQEAEDPCAREGACRHIAEYVLQGPDGTTARLPAGVDLPWVFQGNVIVTPGEAVVVELVEEDGTLTPHLRRTGEDARTTPMAEGEVRFDFAPVENGRVMVRAVSQYPEALEYAALMVDANVGPERTSVCTLMPGVTVFEAWQQPIYQLAFWSFRPATDGYTCSIIDPDAAISEADRDAANSK